MDKVEFRAAEISDIPALLAIEERSFETDRMSPRSFRHLLTRARAECIIALDNGRPVGYAAVFFRRNAAVARLHSLAVDPCSRGRHAGRAILAKAEENAREHGAKTLRLAVRSDNRAAIRLYQSSGYKELETEFAYYVDGMSALHMEKALATPR